MPAPTVPSTHQTLPALPDDSKSLQSQETNPAVIRKAKGVSAAKLRQKNRHQRRIEIEFPMTLQFESATNYLLEGFGPQIDGKWTCDEVEIRLRGKQGSETTVWFYQTPDFTVNPSSKRQQNAAEAALANSDSNVIAVHSNGVTATR
jgi:hypothetical protein